MGHNISSMEPIKIERHKNKLKAESKMSVAKAKDVYDDDDTEIAKSQEMENNR